MICIYKIENIITNDFYIGSTVNYSKRIATHKNALCKNKHHSIILQRAYNKYGKDFFKYTVLEICTKDQLKEKEMHYLTELKPVYNISKDAIAPMRFRKHSEETKLKFKSIIRPKGLKRKPWSLEQREKILKSRVGKTRSEEFKIKQSVNAINKNLNKYLLPFIEKRKRKIIDSNNIIHNSMLECAKYHNISAATVCDILKGKHKQTRNKVSFKYYES